MNNPEKSPDKPAKTPQKSSAGSPLFYEVGFYCLLFVSFFAMYAFLRLHKIHGRLEQEYAQLQTKTQEVTEAGKELAAYIERHNTDLKECTQRKQELEDISKDCVDELEKSVPSTEKVNRPHNSRPP